MKILLPLFLLFANTVFAQSEPTAPDKTAPADSAKVYQFFDVEKPPVFPGGEPAMLKFLAGNIKYPTLAREKNIQGAVLAEFVIEENGSLSNLKVVRDIGGGCGEEVLRIIALMPNWTPGEQNGKVVKVRHVIPVRFRLEGGKKSKKKKN